MLSNAYRPSGAVAITPSDSTQLGLCGFYVGGTGDVAVVTELGDSVTFKACPVGFQVAIGITQIKATGTTATNILGYKP